MEKLTAIIITIITAIYSAFPTLPVYDCFRKYLPVGNDVQVYMLAPENESLMESFVIKTENNKIIVMDGGLEGKGTEAEPYLPSAIRAILGLGQKDYFEVEAWFLSHNHNDHYYELAKMLNSYDENSNYRINNIYFHFCESDGEKAFQTAFHEGLYNYYRVNGLIDKSVTDVDSVYKDLNGKVINSKSVEKGLSIAVDSVNMDVLLDWEEGFQTINSTSVVYRMRCNGHSILFLGDSYLDTEVRLLKKYSANELKSDYVQLAHHGQNGVSKEFYDAIGTKDSIRLWCTPIWVWNTGKDSQYQIPEVRTWMDLPFEPSDYISFEKDYVACLYEHYPKDPAKTKYWNKAVLDAQRIAVF